MSVNVATANGSRHGRIGLHRSPEHDVTFADGDTTSKTVTVSIIDDTLDETNETFTVGLSGVTGGSDLGTATSTVTIVDNDAAQQPGTLAIAPAATSVNEGAGTVTLTVSRTGGSDGVVSVNVATANGTALAGSDYTAVPSMTLTFGDGDTTPKSVTVSIIDDSQDENNETFTVGLSGVTGGAALGTATSTVTIVDNDVPGPGSSSISGSIFLDEVENVSEVIHDGAVPFRDGQKDFNEKGFGGLPVQLSGPGVSLTVYTDFNGMYRFNGLANGTYTVEFDKPDTILSTATTSHVVTISGSGSINSDGHNFPAIGTRGSALETVDIISSSYLRTNGEMSALSNKGREGGVVSLDSSGNLDFIMIADGFEGVSFAELVLNEERDAALLTVIKGTEVLTTRLSSDHFVVTADGRGVQFYGGMDDFVFANADAISIEDEFANFRNAIDLILSTL